jgi:hypothetical protein
VPATVAQYLPRDGCAGGITILKEHLTWIRPRLLPVRTFKQTAYLPGEISQIDWWQPGGRSRSARRRRASPSRWWATLPASAAHAARRLGGHGRLAGATTDASGRSCCRQAVERGFLRSLLDLAQTPPDISRPGSPTTGSAEGRRLLGPPGLSGRRVAARCPPTEVVITLGGREIAGDWRSYVPVDLVSAPAHTRALRRAREGPVLNRAGAEIELPGVRPARYDALADAASCAVPPPTSPSCPAPEAP